MSDQSKGPLIQSVERALDVLEALAGASSPLRSAEVAEQLGLHVNTTNNLLRTLFRRGYLSQDEHRRYQLGAQCVAIGGAADRWGAMREVAQPILQELSRDTGDSSFLGVNADGKLLCVALTQGTGAIIVLAKQAWLDQFHCTATGKLLLAFSSAEERERILSSGPLTKNTENTRTSPAELAGELDESRARGYATAMEESGENVASLAVPVIDSTGVVRAVLAQSFPSFFVSSRRISFEERAATLRGYADGLGGMLK